MQKMSKNLQAQEYFKFLLMNNSPHIKVLILNYNGEKILNRCVQSVLDSDYENLSIDVIDNNSQR